MVRNDQLRPIRYGRKISYTTYNKIWAKWVKMKPADKNGEMGEWISPNGSVWRPCGVHYPGILLVNWETGQRHSVDFGTLLKMELTGWHWRSDSRGEAPKFTISRWQDGTHYYVRKSDGDPIVFKGKEKYYTYEAAHRAGTRWSKSI